MVWYPNFLVDVRLIVLCQFSYIMVEHLGLVTLNGKSILLIFMLNFHFMLSSLLDRQVSTYESSPSGGFLSKCMPVFFSSFSILCSRFCALSIESSRCFMHISSKFTVTAIQLHHHIQGMYSSLQIQLEYPSKPELRCARKTQHSVKPKGVRSSS